MASVQETQPNPNMHDFDASKEAKKIVGKVSHDQLCDTIHKQTQYYDKDWEKDLLAVSVSEAERHLKGKPSSS